MSFLKRQVRGMYLQVKYLEYLIDEKGLLPTQEKVLAIQKLPLQGTWLGLFKYYSFFQIYHLNKILCILWYRKIIIGISGC